MKIIKQLGIILVFCVLGEFLSFVFNRIFSGLVIPGTILGMILMLLALFTKTLKESEVEEVGLFLTNNMPFFFVPAAVSVMEYFNILQPIIIELLIIVVVGAFITFTVTTLTVKFTLKIQNKLLRGKTNDGNN